MIDFPFSTCRQQPLRVPRSSDPGVGGSFHRNRLLPWGNPSGPLRSTGAAMRSALFFELAFELASDRLVIP